MPRSSEITNVKTARLALTGATVAIFLAPTPLLGAPSAAAILQVPGSQRLEQRLFQARASGVLSNAGGAAATGTISLFAGTDTVVANDGTALATITGNVPAGAAVSYHLEVDLLFDNVSGTLFGSFSGFIGTTLVARTVIAAYPTGLNGNNEPVFNLVLGAGIGTANAANYALCNTFAIEA